MLQKSLDENQSKMESMKRELTVNASELKLLNDMKKKLNEAEEARTLL